MDNNANSLIEKPDFAVTLANHWSYIGIGWTMGIESCVQSLVDSFTVAKPQWCIKTCINLDAATYEEMQENFPEVIDSLKAHLKAGKVEIIGGTYSQPLGTMIGNESNIRQLVMGREVIKKYLGEDVDTFLEEEEFSHPQLPQLLNAAGYRYASIAQCDTGGSSGIPLMKMNSFLWQAKDGAEIPCIPKNPLFLHPPVVTSDIEYYQTPEGRANIDELKKSGVPLAVVWTEFGWEPLGEIQYHNKFDPERYNVLRQKYNVVFVTIKKYMEKFAKPSEAVRISMDDFSKLLPWGIGGDQLRVHDRRAEALLLGAERWDAFSYLLDPEREAGTFEDTWKNLLTAQSHDVSLCEFYDWKRLNFFARNRLANTHETLWGAIGYTYLDRAMSSANKMLGDSLESITSKIDSCTDIQGDLAVTVFNPCVWERKKFIVTTGKIYLKDMKAKGLMIVDAQGKPVSSQIIWQKTDPDSDIIAADMAFEAESVPSCGYSTYYVQFTGAVPEDRKTGLNIDKDELIMENEYTRIRLDKIHGSIVSLIEKNTGKEFLNSEKDGFGIFRGRVNQQYCKQYGLKEGPEFFNTSDSEAVITWIEEGPVRASVSVLHTFPHVKFEMLVTLCVNSPAVAAACRVRAIAPPAVYQREPGLSQSEGYWLDFSPGFTPEKIYRDIPFSVEATAKDVMHGFSFIDMVGDDRALMLAHSGTQYFKKECNAFSNLLMRDWNRILTVAYGGWQSYCEYEYMLIPHEHGTTHQERLKMSMDMDYKARSLVNKPSEGSLPKEMSFLTVDGKGIVTTSFRKKARTDFELRLFETEGNHTDAVIKFAVPIREGYETDLLGNRIRPIKKESETSLVLVLEPYKITTIEVTLSIEGVGMHV